MFTAIVLVLVVIILAARSHWSVPVTSLLKSTAKERSPFLPVANCCRHCPRPIFSCLQPVAAAVPAPSASVSSGWRRLHVADRRVAFYPRDADEGWRLSCQTAVKQDMKIEVPEEVFGVKQWECTVESNPNVATFIKELTLRCRKARMWISAPAAMCSWSARHTT